MPFGMKWDEFRDTAAAARAGSPSAAARIRSGSGLHIHRSAALALGAAGVVLGGRAAMSRPAVGTMMTLSPGSGPAPVSGPGEYGPGTTTGCSFITDWRARLACEAATRLLGGDRGPAANTCPPGYHRGADGSCVIDGPASWIPGDIGRPDVIWTPVHGRYGAGHSPIAVQRERLECPPGEKLGRDNVCYECLKKNERKWNPGTKPFLTGGDVNAIRRANRLRKKFTKLRGGKGALFPQPAARAPRKKGKR